MFVVHRWKRHTTGGIKENKLTNVGYATTYQKTQKTPE